MKLCSGSRAPGGQFQVAVIKEKNCALRQWEVACATWRPMGCPPLGGPPLDCADPGRGTAERSGVPGPGRACWGGRDLFWRLHCSLSFPEGSRGCPVASLHFRPQYTFQRQTVLSGRRDPQPCLACSPPQGISGMPRPLGSCLLCLAHPISSLAVPAFPTLGLPSWFSASLSSDWATPTTLTTSLSPADSA